MYIRDWDFARTFVWYGIATASGNKQHSIDNFENDPFLYMSLPASGKTCTMMIWQSSIQIWIEVLWVFSVFSFFFGLPIRAPSGPPELLISLSNTLPRMPLLGM